MAFPIRDQAPNPGATWATWGLLVCCVLTFAFLQPKPMQGLSNGWTLKDRSNAELQIRRFTDRWALVPCEITHARSIAEGAACEGFPVDNPDAYAHKNIWLPLLTSMFLHQNLLHLFSNMLFLWIFGRGLEQRIGSPGVLGLFLAGGLVSFLGYVAATPESTNPLLGASGAIAALMGAFLVLQPRRRILTFVYAAGLQVAYLPAWVVLASFFVAQFFTAAGSSVAWQAHVAGMGFGGAVGALWWWRIPATRDTTATLEDLPALPLVPDPGRDWPTTLPSRPPTGR